jgi:hypothetical protein
MCLVVSYHRIVASRLTGYEVLVAAKWMYDEYKKREMLLHRHAVAQIRKQFGDRFVSQNSINPRVLHQFERVTPEAVWERESLLWRARRAGDPKRGRLAR